MTEIMLPKLPRGTAAAALDRLFPEPNPYLGDPVAWAERKLRRFLWSKQREIIQALVDHRRVAVQSAHATGKSFNSSVAGAHHIDVHEFGEAFLVSTAPSWPQVETILWRELRRRHREAGMRGRITQDCKWHMSPYEHRRKHGDSSEEIVGIGRKPADYNEQTFQGIHARYFMAILDEACGIPEWLWNAVLALATNEHARILAIGNPDDPNSHFAKVCRPGSGWHVIKVSAFDTPAFTGEEVPQEVLDGLVSKQWVDDRRQDWGEGSPIWIAKVEGEFPDISDEYLITPSLIERCRQLALPGHEIGRYGADVARMGADKTVVYWNRGGMIRRVAAWGKKDTMETAGLFKGILTSHGAARIPMTVDIVGVGAGVYDRLREQRLNVAPYQGSERARNPKKFRNRRSEAWWTFRELMEAGLIDLDPEDDLLAAQLGSIKWSTDSSDRIYVETKEDMRERGLPSPDYADAAVLSTVASGSMGRAVTENDILGEASLTGDLLTRMM